MTDAPDLRMAPDTARTTLIGERDLYERYAERLLTELAQAQVERDQLLAQRDALKARLVWAEGELGKIWAALRDAR
jgi:hypothetical protein